MKRGYISKYYNLDYCRKIAVKENIYKLERAIVTIKTIIKHKRRIHPCPPRQVFGELFESLDTT